MDTSLVFGDRYLPVTLPDSTTTLSAGVGTSMQPLADLPAAVREALANPVDTPPLRELARGKQRVTIAFDDPTVPCFAPVWTTVIPIVLEELEAGGVRRSDVTLLCANALHRQFSREELAGILGADLVAEFGDRLRCHDAENPDEMEHLGVTPNGYDVELSKLVTQADLTVYVNASTIRGFSGGWKSICVGLSTYRSIRHHHTPDDMSMSLHRNRMHEMLDEMGQLVVEKLGRERIFKVETILANPLAVARMTAGTVDGTRAIAVQENLAHQDRRRTDDKHDIILYGVPDWSPYAAYSFTNPILSLVSTGLGYLGGMIEGAGAPGCTVILATPCPLRWDERAHPSYPEVWERVVPQTRDPYEVRERFEAEYATNERYIERYRFHNGFHPVHGILALFPLKRLKHAGRVMVAGAEDPGVPRHLGFQPHSSVEDALKAAFEIHGATAPVGLVPYPMAFNRQ